MLPLTVGRSLGRGATTGVHEVACQGIMLARKQIFCNRRMRIEDFRRELEILKRVSHKHIITLVGSYTQKNILGLLLFPAAVCDLGTFLDELDEQQRSMSDEMGDGLSHILERLQIEQSIPQAQARLRKVCGCVANAVNYLHRNNIRHKDLKPSNILLNPNDGLFLTTLASAETSRMPLQVSLTGPPEGPTNICAPEIARWEPRGRAADVYSLGCVFFQIQTVCQGLSLLDFDNFRMETEDQSFQSNPEKVGEWILKLRSLLGPVEDFPPGAILDLVEMMLSRDPATRPAILFVGEYLVDISVKSSEGIYFGHCCVNIL